jgi:LysR family transcriptional activator of glutamate synthase operon
VPSTAKSLLPEWSRNFRRLYPEAELTVLEGHHVEVCDWIDRGIADLGFAAVVPRHLRAEQIRDEPLILVAHRTHPLLHASTLTMSQLARETLVTGGFGCEPVLNTMFNEAGLAIPKLVQAQDVATALEIVRQGFGVSLLPDTALLQTNLIDLRTRTLPVEVRRRLYLIAPDDGEPLPAVGRFLEVIRKQSQPVVAPHKPA